MGKKNIVGIVVLLTLICGVLLLGCLAKRKLGKPVINTNSRSQSSQPSKISPTPEPDQSLPCAASLPAPTEKR